MAEFAQRRLELALPELEEIAKLDIFSAEEMKQIVNEHSSYEYKLSRRVKSVQLYLRYVDYKQSLMGECLSRMKEKAVDRGTQNNLKKLMRDSSKKIYRDCVTFFPYSLEAWDRYLNFLHAVKMYSVAFRAIEQMLKYTNTPDMFCKAALFCVQKCKCVDRGRSFLLDGIHIHPRAPCLYVDLFRLEVENWIRKWQEYRDNEELREDILLRGDTFIEVFKSAMEAELSEELLNSLIMYTLNREVVAQAIYELFELWKTYRSKSPRMWNYLAMLQLQGLDYENMTTYFGNKTKKDPVLLISKCREVYLEGIKVTGSSDMKRIYVSSMLLLPRRFPDCKFAIDAAVAVTQDETLVNLFIPIHFCDWMQLINIEKDPAHFTSVSKRARGVFPTSPEVLETTMQLFGKVNQYSSVIEVLDKALNDVKDQPVLKRVFTSALQVLAPVISSKLDTIVSLLVKPPVISAKVALRSELLQYVLRHCSTDTFKQLFSKLNEFSACQLEDYFAIINTELNATNVDITAVRNYYEEACRHFGSVSKNLWMEYVKFEMHQGEPANISNLYWKAVKQLEPRSSDQFIGDFALWKAHLEMMN